MAFDKSGGPVGGFANPSYTGTTGGAAAQPSSGMVNAPVSGGPSFMGNVSVNTDRTPTTAPLPMAEKPPVASMFNTDTTNHSPAAMSVIQYGVPMRLSMPAVDESDSLPGYDPPDA